MNSAEQVATMIARWKAEGIEKANLMTRIGEAEIGWPYAWGATGQPCTVKNREHLMNGKKIGDKDRELIRKRCQVLNGSKSSCEGCKYLVGGKCVLLHDCIAFINELLTYAEIPHYGAGCSTMWNRNSQWERKGKLADMPETVCLVFQQYPGNDKKMQHIGLYIGGGYVIHCSVEVKKEKLSAYPWTHYGILYGMGGDVPVTHKTIKKGSTGPDVVLCQQDLIFLGYDLGPKGADGIFGTKTDAAVRAFQGSKGLKQDGIVGKDTWAALDAAVDPGPEPPVTQLYTVIIPHLTEEQANALQAQYPDAEKRKEG